MTVHVMRGGAGRLLAGVAAVVVTAAGCAWATVASYDLNPAGPVLLVLGAAIGGSLLARRAHDLVLKSAGLGLVAGATIAVLLWPLFAVD